MARIDYANDPDARRTLQRAERGDRLRALRDGLGLDIVMAARLCGLTPATITNAETGATEMAHRTMVALVGLYGEDAVCRAITGSAPRG